MIVGVIKIKMYAPWISSLKEKRSYVKSIIAKSKNKYNISIAEVDEQDTHELIVIGISFVSNSKKQIDKISQEIINYIEDNFEPELIDIQMENL